MSQEMTPVKFLVLAGNHEQFRTFCFESELRQNQAFYVRDDWQLMGLICTITTQRKQTFWERIRGILPPIQAYPAWQLVLYGSWRERKELDAIRVRLATMGLILPR